MEIFSPALISTVDKDLQKLLKKEYVTQTSKSTLETESESHALPFNNRSALLGESTFPTISKAKVLERQFSYNVAFITDDLLSGAAETTKSLQQTTPFLQNEELKLSKWISNNKALSTNTKIVQQLLNFVYLPVQLPPANNTIIYHNLSDVSVPDPIGLVAAAKIIFRNHLLQIKWDNDTSTIIRIHWTTFQSALHKLEYIKVKILIQNKAQLGILRQLEITNSFLWNNTFIRRQEDHQKLLRASQSTIVVTFYHNSKPYSRTRNTISAADSRQTYGEKIGDQNFPQTSQPQDFLLKTDFLKESQLLAFITQPQEYSKLGSFLTQ